MPKPNDNFHIFSVSLTQKSSTVSQLFNEQKFLYRILKLRAKRFCLAADISPSHYCLDSKEAVNARFGAFSQFTLSNNPRR
jgi:hypothetical protein